MTAIGATSVGIKTIGVTAVRNKPAAQAAGADPSLPYIY